MNKGVSIILCTYNGKHLLSDTLQHIVNQKNKIPCELIFVDNASNDGTKKYADMWWKNHGSKNIIYRSFEQPVPGKSYAQNLGYEKANYEYLLVCDDDNWLSNTYVQTAYDVMESNKQIGALGGWCEAVFEEEEPNWFNIYAKYFAVAKQGKKSGDITDEKGCLYGAGMVLRKSHWLELQKAGFSHLLSCRKGNKLSSGGDTEYSYALRLLDYKIWYDERLYFKHYMPKARMNLNYLRKLRKALSHSNFILKSYKDVLQPKNRTYKEYLKSGRIYFFINGLKKIYILLMGSYEEKEQEKDYFRQLYYITIFHKKYKENKQHILQWVEKTKK